MLPPDIQKSYNEYLDAKYGEASKFPRIKVTTEEFIKMLMETGMTEESAKTQVTVAKGLGSECKIGERWVGIKDETD